MIELLPQQVFNIIQSQMCYLVFKLSEKCHGLHCPVKVRDVLHWKNKEIGLLYFRTPDPWNIHDNTRVPKKRGDGWKLLCGNSTQLLSFEMIIFLCI